MQDHDDKLDAKIVEASVEQSLTMSSMNSSLISEIGFIRIDVKDSIGKLHTLMEERNVTVSNLIDSNKKDMITSIESLEQKTFDKLSGIETSFQDSMVVLKSKDSTLTDTIEDLNDAVQRIQSSIASLEGKLDQLMESTIPTLSERIASIEAIAKQNDRRLEVIETESDRVKRTGASREEVDNVRAMLFELQGNVMQNSGKVLDVVTQLSAFKKMDSLDGQQFGKEL